MASLKSTLLLPFSQVRSEVVKFFGSFINGPRHLIILKLTLLFVFFYTKSDYALHVPLKILAIYMVLSDDVVKSKGPWILLSFWHIIILILQWDYIDNHKYLSIYWIISCLLSLYSNQPVKLLRFNASFIIGTVFAIATLQKLFGGQYLNGSFLHFTFITDGRFEVPVGLWGNLTTDILPGNYQALDALIDFPAVVKSLMLKSNSSIANLALFASYWTLFIESILGLFFLLPLWPKYERFAFLKDYSLLLFMVTTYGIVMVAGFNFLLILWGFAQTKENEKVTALLYLLGLMIFEARNVPWLTYFIHVFNFFT